MASCNKDKFFTTMSDEQEVYEKGLNVKRLQQGFTLIELILVIVLLGILAATALPKFSSIAAQARTSAAQGVGGALGSAASIAHAQWLAGGQVSPITLEGTSIPMSTNGWPECQTCTPSGTATAAKCLEVWNNVLNNPPIAGATCTGTCQYLVTGTAATCTFTAQQGAGPNSVTYNISTGAVVAQ
jgi:prepilin-type N-terminal cleavage/methylation domain-containing protein